MYFALHDDADGVDVDLVIVLWRQRERLRGHGGLSHKFKGRGGAGGGSERRCIGIRAGGDGIVILYSLLQPQTPDMTCLLATGIMSDTSTVGILTRASVVCWLPPGVSVICVRDEVFNTNVTWQSEVWSFEKQLKVCSLGLGWVCMLV